MHSSARQGNSASSHGGQSALQVGGDVAAGAVRPSVAKALKSNDGFKCRSVRLDSAATFSKILNWAGKTFYSRNVALRSLYDFCVYENSCVVQNFGEPGV